MTEDFLHYIWKFQKFSPVHLCTTDGMPIVVLHPGIHNTDAGPDFFNAKLKIGSTTWAGNVEIHLRSSGFIHHRHHLDPAYNNVILHVVFDHDREVETLNHLLPTLELKHKIDGSLLKKYSKLMRNKSWVACEKQLNELSSLQLYNWQSRVLLERLQRKTALIRERLQINKNSWEETFYQFLAMNFGFKTNALLFDMLAKTLPLNYLDRHKDNLFQLEALFFGQAGFLAENFNEEVPRQLQQEYFALQRKFKLYPLERHLWKFFRLRPGNFPTIRLAQLSMLMERSVHLFSKILETEDLPSIRHFFSVGTSEYWNDHYHFDRPTKRKQKKLGARSIDNLLINTVVPFLFTYGERKNIQTFKDRALHFLELIDAEENTIIEKWRSRNISILSAYQSQAMIELKNSYCSHKKCLNCAIGNSILTPHKNDR